MFEYHIYGKDACKYCFMAIALLSQRDLPFKEFKLGREFTREELLEQFPSARTFPQIKMINEDGSEVVIGGYDELAKQLG
jgi:glutaredoxin